MGNFNVERELLVIKRVSKFGEIWQLYSERGLDESRVKQVRASLQDLLDQDFPGKSESVTDVGYGSGLFSIGASQLGAQPIVAIDVDEKCVDVARRNAAKWSALAPDSFKCQSILDEEETEKLGLFDIVYAWGSLHHTGRMWEAIRTAAGRTAPGGSFIITIYNKHFTSPIWRAIKWTYTRSPRFVQKLMYFGFVPVIVVTKSAVTRRNPLKSRRGMDFFVDVVDWIGGYPYQYATPDEVVAFVEPMGFELAKSTRGATPIACNEFVFRRN